MKIKVAAVQMVVDVGEVLQNLERAEKLVSDAFAAGAKLVILPECFATGMVFDELMYDAIFPMESEILRRMRSWAITHQGCVGGSFLAARDGEVYNSFVYIEADGTTFVHDKDQPSFHEGNYHRGGTDEGLWSTALGGVGCVLCWEMIRSRTVKRLAHKVKLVVGGCCSPSLPAFLPGSQRAQERLSREMPVQFAKMVGVPVILAAHAGTFSSGLPMMPGFRYKGEYLGNTMIVDRSGEILASLGPKQQAGFVVAELDLEAQATPSQSLPACFWTTKIALVQRYFFWIQGLHGRWYYNLRFKRPRAVSATAHFIAKSLLLYAYEPRFAALIDEKDKKIAENALRAGGAAGERFARRLQSPNFRRTFLAITNVIIPGLMHLFVIRKKIIEKEVHKAIAEGVNHVVVLAAGFDGLANRLHRQYPHVEFVEVDLAATSAVKQRCVEGAKKNLAFHAADLAYESIHPLLGVNQAPDAVARRTLVIAEGLLMYLAESKVVALLGDIAALKSREVRFIFDFIEPDAKAKIALQQSTWFGKLWLKCKKETFRWGIRQSEMGAWLAKNHFQLDSLIEPESMRAVYGLDNEPVGKSEPVCVARLMVPPGVLA